MTRQIATFFLGDTLLGVDILLVKEIYRHQSVNPIPDAPLHLCGLMNLRGRVVTVINLSVCLNRPGPADMEKSRLLILKTQEDIRACSCKELLEDVWLGDDIVGFLIDKMDDVLSVESEDILPPPPNIADIENDLIEGIIKRKDRLVILLNVTAILELIMNVNK
ncbi:MAG: hypothetical protein BWK80_12445 [Desulfobacteraceae bacterium IS3]|nr:MAG: hypothetical protein BWK80_12445 [Desulfobacteraceae bacterium IS3]